MIGLEAIQRNAELVAEQMRPVSGLAFNYDAESVEWLDGYINRTRERNDFKELSVDRLVSVLGSYLGECIVRTYGGEWRDDEDGWGVYLDKTNPEKTNVVYPFNKIRKQFANGEEDSIHSLFTLIPIVFREHLPHLSEALERN